MYKYHFSWVPPYLPTIPTPDYCQTNIYLPKCVVYKRSYQYTLVTRRLVQVCIKILLPWGTTPNKLHAHLATICLKQHTVCCCTFHSHSIIYLSAQALGHIFLSQRHGKRHRQRRQDSTTDQFPKTPICELPTCLAPSFHRQNTRDFCPRRRPPLAPKCPQSRDRGSLPFCPSGAHAEWRNSNKIPGNGPGHRR